MAMESFGRGMKDETDINESEDCIPELPYKVEEILNQTYLNRQEDPLAMDVFKPVVEKNTELPVIVTVHGGGLVRGDRKSFRKLNRILAGQGYLVFSIEYRLAPRANCAQQLDDVCAGMDLIGRELVNYDVDFSRVFLIANSAGAYLGTYVTAMKGSEKLQEAIGYKPSKMVFKAVGLLSGMFYTRKRDPIGYLLSGQVYGDMENSESFLKYMDPENPEILNNVPPAFLVTSRGDFLNNYTLMFHDALKKHGKKTHLLYYGDKTLSHSFVSRFPEREKSMEAIKKMLAWFEEQAAPAKVKPEEEAAPAEVKLEEQAPLTEEKPEEEAASESAKPEEGSQSVTVEENTETLSAEASEEALPEPEKPEEEAAESEKPEEETGAAPEKGKKAKKAEEEPEAEKKPKRSRKKKTEAGNNKSQT